jgi:hypothetical protein
MVRPGDDGRVIENLDQDNPARVIRRRDLLIRAGLLGAAAAVGGAWPATASRAASCVTEGVLAGALG